MNYRAALHPSLRGKWIIYEVSTNRMLLTDYGSQAEAVAKAKALSK